MKKILALGLLAAAAATAQADPFVVDAQANSSSGGTGLSTISLTAGQSFSVMAGLTDLWNAGALPRWSNANGLSAATFATGTDESGQVLGTQIGDNFGFWSQDGFTARYGELVGQIGTSYYHLGTSFTGTAAQSGTLKLFYWDSNNGDNTGSITATVAAVPEPETFALLLAGLGIVGAFARRRNGVSK